MTPGGGFGSLPIRLSIFPTNLKLSPITVAGSCNIAQPLCVKTNNNSKKVRSCFLSELNIRFPPTHFLKIVFSNRAF